MSDMEFLIVVWAIAITIIWIVIGWRAMRAHENIAYTLMRFVASHEEDKSAEIRAEAVEKKKLYRQFIKEDPSREELPPKERHELFRDWIEEKEE